MLGTLYEFLVQCALDISRSIFFLITHERHPEIGLLGVFRAILVWPKFHLQIWCTVCGIVLCRIAICRESTALISEYSTKTKPMPWLLTSWLLASPGNWHSWYWLHGLNRPWIAVLYQCGKLEAMYVHVMFLNENSKHKGLGFSDVALAWFHYHGKINLHLHSHNWDHKALYISDTVIGGQCLGLVTLVMVINVILLTWWCIPAPAHGPHYSCGK